MMDIPKGQKRDEFAGKEELPLTSAIATQAKIYEEATAFFTQRGMKKRTLGAFVLDTVGQAVAGKLVSLERRGPYASWFLKIESHDLKQTAGFWVNDIVADQVTGLPKGTVIGLLFKGWVEGRQFNYRDYDVFIGELPDQEGEKK